MKRIKQSLRNVVRNGYEAIDEVITKINNGSSARRGIGTTGAKVNKSLYRCGGKKK